MLHWQTDDRGSFFSSVLQMLDEAERAIQKGPVAPAPDAIALRDWLENIDFQSTADPIPLIVELLRHFRSANVHTTNSRYFGLFNPAPMIWGELADMISARLNPQVATWSHAPAAVETEQHVLSFMSREIGFDRGAAFFTSGGEEANRAGVQTAMAMRFPDYGEVGLRGLPAQPVLYVSAESHLAWIKIAASIGLGRQAVRLIPTSPNLKIDLTKLSNRIAKDRTEGLLPFFVGATAGTTSAGVIDPLPELADLALQERLHLHVDAAWAGAVLLSNEWRAVLHGVELADSVTIDAHKWLSQPMGTGMFFSREPTAPERAYEVSASYMPARVEGQLDYYRTTPMWSRRWIGLRLFLSLAVIGKEGFAAQIDRDIELGQRLREILAAEGWRVINDTPLPVVCFTDAKGEHDASWHARVAEDVVGSGHAWISTVSLNSRPALRACITNWRSEMSDLLVLIRALDAARKRLQS